MVHIGNSSNSNQRVINQPMDYKNGSVAMNKQKNKPLKRVAYEWILDVFIDFVIYKFKDTCYDRGNKNKSQEWNVDY